MPAPNPFASMLDAACNLVATTGDPQIIWSQNGRQNTVIVLLPIPADIPWQESILDRIQHRIEDFAFDKIDQQYGHDSWLDMNNSEVSKVQESRQMWFRLAVNGPVTDDFLEPFRQGLALACP